MSLGDFLSPIFSIFRFIASLFLRNSAASHKKLQVVLIDRGIVAELPIDFPFHICDEKGQQHRGVYVIALIVWNRGNQAVTKADFTSSAPLRISVGEDAEIANTNIIPIERQTVCACELLSSRTVQISFDCINPMEYIVIPMFVTGNPRTEISVTGRIIGQDSEIDLTSEEGKASVGERLSALFFLMFSINALPGLPISGWIIAKHYGLSTLWHNPETIPHYLHLSFGLGVVAMGLYISSRFMYWSERRKVPKGYPLRADLEPPLIENLKGLCRMAFKGQRQRVSISMFDWGKPVIMAKRKMRRRTIEDWIA